MLQVLIRIGSGAGGGKGAAPPDFGGKFFNRVPPDFGGFCSKIFNSIIKFVELKEWESIEGKFDQIFPNFY